MKVVCPSCNARYRLPDERVRGKVLKIRCKSCGSIFQVRDPNTQAADSASIRDRSSRATGAFGSVGPHGSLNDVQTTPGNFSDERIWYYSVNGESFGPYRESELLARFESGKIGSGTYVWTEGFLEWKLATDEARFAQTIADVANAPDAADAPLDADGGESPRETAQATSEASARRPRRKFGHTMSLDAAQLDEQLQSESQVTGSTPAARDTASRRGDTASPRKEANSGLYDTLSSESFVDSVEHALDEMFGGGFETSEPASPTTNADAATTDHAATSGPLSSSRSAGIDADKPRTAAAKSAQDTDKPQTAAAKTAPDADKPKTAAAKTAPGADKPQTSTTESERDAAGDDDSLSGLKSFLARSREERRRRTEKNAAIVVEDRATAAEPADDAALTDDARLHDSIDQSAAVPPDAQTDAEAPAPDADERTSEDEHDADSELGAVDAGGAKSSRTDVEEGDIDISELLALDIGGTGFGQNTAQLAAVDDAPKSTPDEETDGRRSNVPLVLIIIILVIAIALVAVELFSSDEPPSRPIPEQPIEQRSAVGPESGVPRPLSPAELRDRRLAMGASRGAVADAARVAAKAAFAAVPAEIKNPELARRAAAAPTSTGRSSRPNSDSSQDSPRTVDSDVFENPTAAFAQPTLGRSSGADTGPSRQAFANGLNTFVQQSVFQCQQAHMRREGELALSRVAVSIRVQPTGTVSSVGVPARLEATTFANCLRSQSRNWRFPAFSGDSALVERTYIIQ